MEMHRIDLLDNGVYLYESHHEFGDRVRPHGHAIPQILYALEGRGHIIVGGQNHHVLPDDAVFLAPYTEHAVVCDYELTLLVLAFDPTRVDMAPLTTMLSLHFSQSAYIPLSSFSAAEIRPLLRKLLFEQSKAGSLSEMAMKAYLFELLIILARATKTPHVTDSNGLRAERTRAYIDEHYFASLTVDSLAGLVGIGGRHLNELFKEQYGTTPIQYLASVRVERAKKLLLETNKDIVSIGFEVGYENLSTFYRNFKNMIGVSPAKYRTTQTQPDHAEV